MARLLAAHATLLAGAGLMLLPLVFADAPRLLRAAARFALPAFAWGLGLLHNFGIFPDAGFG